MEKQGLNEISQWPWCNTGSGEYLNTPRQTDYKESSTMINIKHTQRNKCTKYNIISFEANIKKTKDN